MRRNDEYSRRPVYAHSRRRDRTIRRPKLWVNFRKNKNSAGGRQMSIPGAIVMAVLGAGCAAHTVYFIIGIIRLAKADRAVEIGRGAPPVTKSIAPLEDTRSSADL